MNHRKYDKIYKIKSIFIAIIIILYFLINDVLYALAMARDPRISSDGGAFEGV